MKNTSAVEVESSEKGKPRGKTYRIPISNGIFEHYPKLKLARWLLDLYIDWTTKEVRAADGSFDGIVLGGKPISDAYVAGAFPVKGGPGERTIWVWRNLLARYGYITQKRTPIGYVITVKKSKKWPQSESQKVATHSSSDPQNLRMRTVKPADQNRRTCGSRSDSAVQDRDVAEETAAAASNQNLKVKSNTKSPEGKSSGVSKEAWEAVGEEGPFGPVWFVSGWEKAYAERPAGEKLSDTMENYAQGAGRKLPPKFYDPAKRWVEEQEANDDSDVALVARGEYNRAESEKACAKMEAEREAKQEAEKMRFDALSQEEKLAELRAKLADNEQWITNAKAGSGLAEWALEQKAELERKIAELSSPPEISLSPEEEIQLLSQFPEAWDAVDVAETKELEVAA